MKQMRSIQTLVSSENCILNGEFDGIESINCDSFLVLLAMMSIRMFNVQRLRLFGKASGCGDVLMMAEVD